MKKKKFFCYVYKVQRKCSWFCDLLWNNYFITLIIINIFVEIEIIGFEKKLNEDLEKKKLYQNIIIIIIYLLFFIGFAIASRIVLEIKFDKFLPNIIKNNKIIYDDDIFIFIFYPILLISFINIKYLIILFLQVILKKISIIFFGKFLEYLKSSIDYCFIPMSVSLVKFVNYFETELLLVVLDTSGIDILSNSFVLSSFYIIYDIIVFIITDIYDYYTKILIWVQLGFSAFISISSYLYLKYECY